GLATRAGGPPGLAGTPGYLAPELLEEPASVKSDVFALAATLYHLLTGAPPFDAKDPYASLVQARAGLPRPLPALDGQPAGVEEVLGAGLEPDPRRRPDPDAFLAELRHVRVLGLVKVMVRNAQNTACPVRLDVTVSTADAGDKVYREQLRCRGGEPARVVRCRTGDLLRVEAAADADGYLTVLNFSSTGELEVLLPHPKARKNRIKPGEPHEMTVQLTPPSGTDGTALIGTRRRKVMQPAEWRDWVVTERVRGQQFVSHETGKQVTDSWTAVVLTVEHGA